MVENLVKYLENKKILIWGFGIEGKSTYKWIRKYLKDLQLDIMVRDEFTKEDNELIKEDSKVKILVKNQYECLENYDLIIKSPGVVLKSNDERILKKITSELELLLEFIPVYTIGITGSKGKSTTSSLIYSVIKDQGIKTMLLGNIGTPVFDYLDQIDEKTILVLEISSHQLEYIKASTNIGVLLNVYEEHLDHYNSMQDYINAKMNLVRYQKENDFCIYNMNNEIIVNELKNINLNSVKYGIDFENLDINLENVKRIYKKDDIIYENENKIYNSNDKRKLLGKHNLNNIMFVLAVSKILQLNLNKTIETIREFNPLPHRLEYVGTYDDIIFYNDSIATIPEAVINSVETLKNVNTLIIGGMDRGVSFENFIEYLDNSEIQNLICMPTTGTMIGNKIQNKQMNVFFVETLEKAVRVAKKVTNKNKICLLSPAAASYEYFANFQEKGEAYKKFVRISD